MVEMLSTFSYFVLSLSFINDSTGKPQENDGRWSYLHIKQSGDTFQNCFFLLWGLCLQFSLSVDLLVDISCPGFYFKPKLMVIFAFKPT